MAATPDYLAPYARAADVHGGGFGTLLWSSPGTQKARFEALVRVLDPRLLKRTIFCDAGCGRADLVPFFKKRGVQLEQYIGIEAIPELVAEAKRQKLPNGLIIEADFVADPKRLAVGADVIYFGGSLNTLDDEGFYAMLKHAWNMTGKAVALSFLSSKSRARDRELYWRLKANVGAFFKDLGAGQMDHLDDYLDGDCTFVAVRKDALLTQIR
jgi:hypothetical protein